MGTAERIENKIRKLGNSFEMLFKFNSRSRHGSTINLYTHF